MRNVCQLTSFTINKTSSESEIWTKRRKKFGIQNLIWNANYINVANKELNTHEIWLINENTKVKISYFLLFIHIYIHSLIKRLLFVLFIIYIFILEPFGVCWLFNQSTESRVFYVYTCKYFPMFLCIYSEPYRYLNIFIYTCTYGFSVFFFVCFFSRSFIFWPSLQSLGHSDIFSFCFHSIPFFYIKVKVKQLCYPLDRKAKVWYYFSPFTICQS